jgi:hypothetical protein
VNISSSDKPSIFILDSYAPVADSCEEFYKLGMFPNRGECLDFRTGDGLISTCCWNNLKPKDASMTVS